MLRGILYFMLFLLIVGGALAGSWYMGWIDDEVAAAGRMVRSAGVASDVSSAVKEGDLRFAQSPDDATIHPGTIAQVAARYGSREPASITGESGAYNDKLTERLLEIEQTRITEIEAALGADPDHLKSFNDDWSILVVSSSVKLDLQLFALEQDLGTEWWQEASRGWKLVLLHDHRRALEQELEMRDTGIVTNRRHALLQHTATTIGTAVEAHHQWMQEYASETP